MQKTPNRTFRRRGALLAFAGLLLGTAAATAGETGKIDVELNSLSQSAKGCEVSFVMRNGFETAIDALTFEIVLFDDDGRIASLLNLKAGDLPVGKTRVKQFRLAKCERVSRILINDVSECSGTDLTPKACLQKLNVTNRTGVKFGL
ncbi:MAG: hypothetical protein C0606_06280 [Hyphomicrobiales bacterium]|nr:MAG: hypothetical protein C0606_06280 [Hyphomicrobiales bacterium]